MQIYAHLLQVKLVLGHAWSTSRRSSLTKPLQFQTPFLQFNWCRRLSCGRGATDTVRCDSWWACCSPCAEQSIPRYKILSESICCLGNARCACLRHIRWLTTAKAFLQPHAILYTTFLNFINLPYTHLAFYFPNQYVSGLSVDSSPPVTNICELLPKVSLRNNETGLFLAVHHVRLPISFCITHHSQGHPFLTSHSSLHSKSLDTDSSHFILGIENFFF